MAAGHRLWRLYRVWEKINPTTTIVPLTIQKSKHMKRQHSFSRFLFLLGALFLTMAVQAQKEKNVEQVKALPKSKQHITKEVETRLTELMLPVKQTLEKLLNEDATGNYKAYKDDIQRLDAITNSQDKVKHLEKMQKKYYAFIKNTWAQAKIDEAGYQQKIKNLFPADQKETIRFNEFLNFTMSSPQKPTPPAPPPPPPPPPAMPPNICINANANNFFRGSFGMDGGAIGSTHVVVAPANPPSPAEIVSVAGSGIVGFYRSQGWIRNTLSVPANFPSDYRVLRSTKRFDWLGMASAVTIAGVCWSTVAYTTTPNTPDFTDGGEMHTAVAPVIWFCTFTKRASKTEEKIFTKDNTTGYQFGITCYASATASIYLSYAHAHSAAAIWKWDICEE